MIRNSQSFILSIVFVFITQFLFGQSISGKIYSNEEPLVGARVFLEGTDAVANTNALGKFRFLNVSSGEYHLLVVVDEYQTDLGFVTVDKEDIDLGILNAKASSLSADASDIAVVNLDFIDEAEGDSQVSSVLTASRDPFQAAAAFNLSAGRFRIRGYESKETEVNLNGFPVNDTDDGNYYWGTWGGLNDVFRNQENTTNLDAIAYSFGGVGGATQIDLRASSQRPQLKIVNDFGNRSYQFRHMLTYSTGEMDNGWSFSFSGSKRWGNRGYIKGTFYDAYSYFASIEKKINDKHSLNVVALGAPSKRGRSSASVQEMYDLLGTNYYNPNWGYSNGKVINSRTYNFHQPIFMLRHDWKINDKTLLTTNVAYKTGYNGSTRLDWYDGADPRPDYYSKLPSQATDSTLVATLIKGNVNFQQIDFDKLWKANQSSVVTIDNINGTNESITGLRSKYIIEEQRFDDNKLSFNTNLNTNIDDNLALSLGLNYLNERVDNYRLVNNLLGGEFYINWDKFLERDNPNNDSIKQYDLRNPNRILKKGDRFGHDFSVISNKYNGWAQIKGSYNQLDLFAAASITSTSFYKDSYVENGAFPGELSFGKSETKRFLNYGTKLGATYKLSGRNYFYGIGTIRTRAPFSRQSFSSPRTNHNIIDGLTNEQIFGGELGYIFRFPSVKGKISAYYTQFLDQLKTRQLYDDTYNVFGTYILKDMDTIHKGVEFGIEAKASQTVTVKFAGAIGAQQYANNPTRIFTADGVDQSKLPEPEVTYLKNMFLNGPQTALSLEAGYRSPKYWFANVSVNYFRAMYLSPYGDRRTDTAVANIKRPFQDDLFYDVYRQTRLNDQVLVNLFAGKSYRINKSNLFIYLSVNNILNNKKFVTGGFEQSRYDANNPQESLDKFKPKLYYAYGTNFSLGVQFRL